MKIYVLTMAQNVIDEWLDVFDTQVFKTIDEARAEMKRQAGNYINDPEYPWVCDWGEEADAVSMHLSYGDNESIWAISEHEI